MFALRRPVHIGRMERVAGPWALVARPGCAYWLDGGDEPSAAPAYRAVIGVTSPIMWQWSRMEVTGLEALPATGPVLLAGNHDSYWDPIAIGVAAAADAADPRAGQVVAVEARDGLGPRRHGPDPRAARQGRRGWRWTARSRSCAPGKCIGIFPEATRSKGRELRARSGFGRLAQAVPEATIVLATVTGTVDVPRFPKRPEVRVDFFRPADAHVDPDEPPAALPTRLLAEIRARAPRVVPGRRPKPVAPA